MEMCNALQNVSLRFPMLKPGLLILKGQYHLLDQSYMNAYLCWKKAFEEAKKFSMKHIAYLASTKTRQLPVLSPSLTC